MKFSVIKDNTLKLNRVKKAAIKVGYIFVPESNENIYVSTIEFSEGKVTCSKVVQVGKNLNWNIMVFGKSLGLDHPMRQKFPTLDATNLIEFFTCLKEANICLGNDDFSDIVKDKLNGNIDFKDSSGNTRAYLETKDFNRINPDSITIRTVNCELLAEPTSSSRCSQCSKYRHNNLNKMRFRKDKSPEVTSKFKPDIHRSKEELLQKVNTLQVSNR